MLAAVQKLPHGPVSNLTRTASGTVVMGDVTNPLAGITEAGLLQAVFDVRVVQEVTLGAWPVGNVETALDMLSTTKR